MGYYAEDVFFNHRWISRRLSRWVLPGHAAVVGVASVGMIVAVFVVGAEYRPRALHLAVVAAAASLPLCAAAFVYSKGRAHAAVSLAVAAAVLAFAAYFHREDLWERNISFITIADRVRSIVAAGGRVAGWGKVNGRTVYYSGQCIPSVKLRLAHLLSRFGQDEGRKRWRQWLYRTDRPLWILGRVEHAEQLREMGFVPAEPLENRPRRDPALFRWQGQRRSEESGSS